MAKTKVLITGGTGLVGKWLCTRLAEKGYTVYLLSRTKEQNTPFKVFTWDWKQQEIEVEALENVAYIIHLAGANIADKRWTYKRKQLLINSRVETGKLILKTLKHLQIKSKAFITASAIGYYGTITSNKIFTENDLPAKDFLGTVCNHWEQIANGFNDLGIRVVKIRTGVVLTRQDGALSKMITPIKMGIGSALGNGKQYLPWIHIDDLCNIYIKAIEDTKMKGVYNAIAPDHKTNYVFTKTIASVLHKPFWFPNIPSFVLKLLFGELSQLLLTGSRVSSEKIISEGFCFKYSVLEKALENLVLKETK
ncbi:MAG: TIGR01777 family oxidoreductase [Cellulophaga sp.]